MPRWAEMIGLAVIGIVVVGALMVYAKIRTTSQKAAAEAIDAKARAERREMPAALAESTEPTAERDKPLSAVEAEAAAARAVARVNLSAAEPAAAAAPQPRAAKPTPASEVVPPPDGVKTAEAAPVEPGKAGADPAKIEPGDDPEKKPADGQAKVETDGDKTAEAGKAGEEKDDEAEGDKEVRLPTPPQVARGTKEELVLLQKAEASLKRLHMLYLRKDIPPEARSKEERRLRYLVAQLPDESKKAMQTWIAADNQRFLSTLAAQTPDEAAAKSKDVAEREVGKADDRPNSEKKIEERIEQLQRAIGGAPPAETGTPRPSEAPAQVNPATLPTAPPAVGGPQGLPSAQSKGLD